MKYKPLADRVIVEQEAAEKPQHLALFYQTQHKKSHNWVRYWLVGQGRYNDKGDLTPLQTRAIL